MTEDVSDSPPSSSPPRKGHLVLIPSKVDGRENIDLWPDDDQSRALLAHLNEGYRYTSRGEWETLKFVCEAHGWTWEIKE